MPNATTAAGYGTLFMLFILIAASVWLGMAAQRVVERGSFMKGYFLGNRGLGAWTLALTATVQSGGTFMGFPSLVYSHGWIVALWICGYMIVPISGFALLGKRLAHLSRRTGAITVPDLFRERYGSPTVGLVAMLFILFYMTFMMVAQFKAGGIIMKVAWPGAHEMSLAENASAGLDYYYYLGLTIFALTVVGYTLIGGFLAAVWTDLFQSVMMLLGVMMLLLLLLPASGGMENATNKAVAEIDKMEVAKLEKAALASDPSGQLTEEKRAEIAHEARTRATRFATGPGYAPDGREFLPVSLAFSFFFVWVFSGVGSPSGVVRVMASSSTTQIRRSIVLLSVYNMMIYIPLVMICVCGRSLIPALAKSDEIIPQLTLKVTDHLPGGSLLAGLILTAPFGAVMATVSGYLVVIASALVRDVYQRFVRPDATRREVRLLTYAVMIVVGIIAFVANLRPVEYLQAIVVFCGTGGATTFVVPLLMSCYWRRATSAGCIAAMLTGGLSTITLYVTGFLSPFDQKIGNLTKFRPYFLLDLDPIVWGLLASLLAGVIVTLRTRPPAEERVSRLFDTPAEPSK